MKHELEVANAGDLCWPCKNHAICGIDIHAEEPGFCVSVVVLVLSIPKEGWQLTLGQFRTGKPFFAC
jgi:hypothetical protein